jgi:DNA-directed RNA polymerase subunit RPC12/RpoP
MKIEAKCDTCGRTFLLSQIGEDSDAPGRCPFCGARFARHYSTVLVETVNAAEAAAANFVHVLGRLQSMETGFDIDIEDLLRRVSEEVRAHESPSAVAP